MALTLAQRNQLRKRAAQEAAKAAPAATMEGATSYELQLAKLTQDRLRLKQVQSNEGKAELKRQLLPEYAPYVEGVLSAGNGAQDEVLTTVMVWRIDAGDFEGALAIAAYVLKHNLVMPDRFERTTGCLIAEEVAEAANKALKADQPFDLDLIAETFALTAEQDMPDEVRAKLHLALARGSLAQVDDKAEKLDEKALAYVGAAIANFTRALELHAGCGGKKELEAAQRLQKKHAAPPAS